MLTSWHFVGDVKDLRSHHVAMPFLTQRDNDALTKCNKIAAEAVASNIAGLLTPSAAKENGTCLPVFQREALKKLDYQHLEKFTIDPGSGDLVITEA
jgi:hypothetical protein